MLRGRATTGGIRHGRGQHRLCPGSLRLRVRQGREIVALHFAYAFGDTALYAHGVCQRSGIHYGNKLPVAVAYVNGDTSLRSLLRLTDPKR